MYDEASSTGISTLELRGHHLVFNYDIIPLRFHQIGLWLEPTALFP